MREATQLKVETQLSLGKDDKMRHMKGGCHCHIVLQGVFLCVLQDMLIRIYNRNYKIKIKFICISEAHNRFEMCIYTPFLKIRVVQVVGRRIYKQKNTT